MDSDADAKVFILGKEGDEGLQTVWQDSHHVITTVPQTILDKPCELLLYLQNGTMEDPTLLN